MVCKVWRLNIRINSTQGMAPYLASPKKSASFDIASNANVGNNMGLSHIDLSGRRQRSHQSNSNTKRKKVVQKTPGLNPVFENQP